LPPMPRMLLPLRVLRNLRQSAGIRPLSIPLRSPARLHRKWKARRSKARRRHLHSLRSDVSSLPCSPRRRSAVRIVGGHSRTVNTFKKCPQVVLAGRTSAPPRINTPYHAATISSGVYMSLSFSSLRALPTALVLPTFAMLGAALPRAARRAIRLRRTAPRLVTRGPA